MRLSRLLRSDPGHLYHKSGIYTYRLSSSEIGLFSYYFSGNYLKMRRHYWFKFPGPRYYFCFPLLYFGLPWVIDNINLWHEKKRMSDYQDEGWDDEWSPHNRGKKSPSQALAADAKALGDASIAKQVAEALSEKDE